MTFDEIKKRVGKNIKYYDDTDGWQTGKDVTETDIGDYVNELYTEELAPLWAANWPHLFRQTATIDSWLVTDTVSSDSTGTTLVIDGTGGIALTNSMIGLKVYNETDDETVEIETFTNSTTVEVDTTIGDTWDGDTIYVIGQEFGLQGDMTDMFTIESVGIKYDSSSVHYLQAEERNKPDLFHTGEEVGSEGRPQYYLTSILDSGNLVSGIGIWPKLEDKISDAIQIDYVSKPSAITSSSLTPIIPSHYAMVAGATMKAYQKMQDMENAAYWKVEYVKAKQDDLSRYRPRSVSRSVKLRAPRRAYHISQRLQ